MGSGSIVSQLSRRATSSSVISNPWSMRSRNWREVLNSAAAGASLPTMRLIATARACSLPAIAVSTHTPPAAR